MQPKKLDKLRFGPGLRAEFKILDVDGAVDEAASQWQLSVAKPRPKRLKVVKAKTGGGSNEGRDSEASLAVVAK